MKKPDRVVRVTAADLVAALARLSTVSDGSPLAAVSLGTPHFSPAEFAKLMPLITASPPRIPVYINTSRSTLEAIAAQGWEKALAAMGVTLVIDTCTYVTSVMKEQTGTVMTNSGKWAWYAPGNLGIEVAFGALGECVASAAAGRVVQVMSEVAGITLVEGRAAGDVFALAEPLSFWGGFDSQHRRRDRPSSSRQGCVFERQNRRGRGGARIVVGVVGAGGSDQARHSAGRVRAVVAGCDPGGRCGGGA